MFEEKNKYFKNHIYFSHLIKGFLLNVIRC